MPDVTINNPPFSDAKGLSVPLVLPNTVLPNRKVDYNGVLSEELVFASTDKYGLPPNAKAVVPSSLTVVIIPIDVADCALGTNQLVYDVGDKVRLAIQFMAGGVGIDPVQVSVSVRLPDQSEYAVPAGGILRLGTGVYRVDYKPIYAGVYWLRVQGSEPAYAAGEVSFTVRARQVLTPGVI